MRNGKSRNTGFMNVAKKPEVLDEFADNLYLASG